MLGGNGTIGYDVETHTLSAHKTSAVLGQTQLADPRTFHMDKASLNWLP